MKKTILSFLFLLTIISAMAQNVGIGTTNPNNSAVLDLSSTTRGFLPPRMTTTQMFGIQNPASGLLVFNSTYDELYQYNGSLWRPLINGTYWLRPIASRSIMSNVGDSIGIGISVPTRLLDVNGSSRIRGNLAVDDVLTAPNVSVSSNLLAAAGTFVGALQTNDQLVINNSSAIFQMKVGSLNKGFLQLSGDDVRIGTNSGNEDGKFIIRNNGGDRLSVDKFGIVNVTNKITSTETGDARITPLCWGLVHFETGNLRRGTDNVTVERVETGVFRIRCSGINTVSCVMVTPVASGLNVGWQYETTGSVLVYLRMLDGSDINHAFSFIIY